jgi:hypothetical protein
MAIDFTVNYLAVLVASVISFILGFVWYGRLFGKAWIKASGWTKQQIEKAKKESMTKPMVIGFINTLVVSYVLAVLVRLAAASTIAEGALVGLIVWLGFYLTASIGSVLWENKSMNLLYINSAFNLLNLIIVSAILAVWQ